MKLVLVHLGNELKLRNGTSFIEAMLESLKQQRNREGLVWNQSWSVGHSALRINFSVNDSAH